MYFKPILDPQISFMEWISSALYMYAILQYHLTIVFGLITSFVLPVVSASWDPAASYTTPGR